MKSFAFIFMAVLYCPLIGLGQLNVVYHQQEKSWYCGAAAAQMVLHFAGFPYSVGGCAATSTDELSCNQEFGLCQTCLYKSNRVTMSQDRTWYSYPDALVNTINYYIRQTDSARFQYHLFTPDDKSVLSQKLLYTLIKYRMPVIVSAFNYDHWIVITGAENPDPASLDVNTTTGYWIHNPFPYLPSTVSNIHSDADSCGKPELEEYSGIANQHVTKDVWFDNYLVPIETGNWSGKYLAVTDTEYNAINPVAISRKRPRNQTEWIISEKKASKYAMLALREEGFIKKEGFGLMNSYSGKPLLVQNADKERSYYYIVPIYNLEDKVIALISIDALTGNYREAAFPSPGKHLNNLIPHLSPTEIIKTIQNVYNNISGDIDSLASSILIEPILQWRTNQFSVSPFYPFHKVKYGGNSYYLRVNSKDVTTNLYYPSNSLITK